MKAKDKHKANILRYLGDPENDIPTRTVLAAIIGLSRETLYQTFTIQELSAIEHEALALRRERYAPQIARIDKAVMKAAERGDAQAAKLAYQRLEGWSERQTHEHEVKPVSVIIRDDDAKL